MSVFQSITDYHARDYSGQHQSDVSDNHNCDMDTLAKRLVAVRKEAGLSQAELAKLAGVKNQSTIGMLESGERKKSTYIPAIAVALNVSALWLADGRGLKQQGISENGHDQAMQDAEPTRPAVRQKTSIAAQSPVVPLPTWPFKRIEQARLHALPREEQDFIEGQLLAAIKEAEARIEKRLASNRR